MAATRSAKTIRAELADARDASRTARELAERELRISVVARSRAAEALERTAARPGVEETHRERLRAQYAAADRVVAQRRAALDKAREFESAAVVVVDAFESEATSASPLAAALLQVVGSKRATTPRTVTRTVPSPRTGSTAGVRSPRPRTA
ncbi:hypothetical protein R8Z57_14130 [Microbacterium sp. M3]|uniref:Uncharacterized protein n=1 Tax=Microbacterium arthrosphaerae TaxID=792652 RepID=A0ABU4H3K5_9MICO|nr:MULTISPECIES: hypothetical protein [Microbacterium]MDW4573916.1 hypothetical protein [Microbacterium arthrosphaerae]MDW7607771.1 hypothetical protein [Microbacterium sp. M3]